VNQKQKNEKSDIYIYDINIVSIMKVNKTKKIDRVKY